MNSITLADKSILALAHVEELSLKKKRELLLALPSPEEWSAKRNDGIVRKVLGDKNYGEFLSNLSSIDDIIATLEKNEIAWLTYYDESYPSQLRSTYDYPLVLFVKGKVSILNDDAVAVVGTRNPTRYGAKAADAFTRDFARSGLVVVSGFARGVDGIAHKACVEMGAPTVAVFACGLDVCYPAEHRGLMDGILANGGAIVSEYPLGTKPLQYHFPERNRIISGLSLGAFLPEATKKSGSLITAKLCVEQGKELFIIPGNIYSPESEGTNMLLQEMPHALVIETCDVLDRLGIKEVKQETEVVELNMSETLIVDALHDKELHFEELIELSGLSAGELNTLLTNLELNGIIEHTGGNYYCLA